MSMDGSEVHECIECQARGCDDEMKQDQEGNWFCKECYWEEPELDEVDFHECHRNGGDR